MNQIFPKFDIESSKIKENVEFYIEKIKRLEAVEKKSNISFDMFKESEFISDELHRYLHEIDYLISVTKNEALEEAFESVLPILSKYDAESGQDKDMFNCVKSMLKIDNLDDIQKRIINNSIKGFKISGLDLNNEDRSLFNKYNEELSLLSNEFSKNVKSSTDTWEKVITNKDDLDGITSVDIDRFKTQAQKKDIDGYLITLQYPDVFSILAYSENEMLRKEVFIAFNSVSSEYLNNGDFDNKEIISKIMKLRHAKAKLLGFKNYAELSLTYKMAKSPEEVVSFLNGLSSKAKDKAAIEKEESLKFAKDELNMETINHWDSSIISRKHKEFKHNIDLSKIQEYFPKKKVESGLFWLINEMFDVTVDKINPINAYHKDVELLKLSKEGKDIAYIYTDLYSRAGKSGGAWMNNFEGKVENSLPVAFVTCNFPASTNENDSLLSFDDVKTLFHEFGHALHHTLSTVKYPSVAGINNVPWDAVELPSTFMEFFCIQPEILKKISGHYKTGEVLPETMIRNMQNADQYNSATGLLNQMNLSISDMLVHMEENSNIYEISNQFKIENNLRLPLEGTAGFNNFEHIYSGGYAAGYYSYKWADILSADIFETFEEQGVLNKELSKKYLNEILSKGGSEEMSDLFKNFKGRNPSPDAFLKYQGILK